MKTRKHHVKYTIRGVADSIRGHCRRYGLCFVTVMYRIHKLGEDPVKAILSKENRYNRNAKHYRVGNIRGTLPELAKKFGLPIYCVEQRIKRGWTVKKALTTPQMNRGPYIVKKYTVKGYTGSLHQIIKHFKCKTSVATVYHRVKNQHMSLEEALMTPLLNLRYPRTTIKGFHGTVAELTRHFKVVSSAAAYERIKAGWSVKDAVLRPAYSVSPCGSQKGNKSLIRS